MVPRVSAKPCLLPAELNAWQGKPAQRMSKSGIFFVSTFVISPVIVSPGWFSCKTLTAYGLISEVKTQTGFNPFSLAASSSPQRIPPMPANRSIKRNTLCFLQTATLGWLKEASTTFAISFPLSILGVNGISLSPLGKASFINSFIFNGSAANSSPNEKTTYAPFGLGYFNCSISACSLIAEFTQGNRW